VWREGDRDRWQQHVSPGVVVHACNPSTWEAEAGGSQVQACLGYIVRPYLNKSNQTKQLQSKDRVGNTLLKWGWQGGAGSYEGREAARSTGVWT
jgi:hypothetical protein